MKKNYLKPEVEMMSMLTINMLATSGNIIPGGGSGEAGEDELGANKHRGEWGNVWAGGSN